MRTSDAHLHDLSCGEPELYVACGTRPEDWDGLPRGPGSVRCYGVHPWHSDLWGDAVEEMLLSRLDSDPGAGVGEIGMDSSREVVGMAVAFESQLSIASERGTFAAIHNVGCDPSVADAVRRLGKGCRSIILHSFSSDSMPVADMAARGCYFSLSPRLLSRRPERVRALVGKVPRDRLLLETDCPFGGGMDGLVSALAPMMGMDCEDLALLAYDNLREAVL